MLDGHVIMSFIFTFKIADHSGKITLNTFLAILLYL